MSTKATEITRDRLLGGRVELAQPANGYRAAIDPVLLAAAVPARAGDTVLDAGIGTGAASLCLAARADGVRIDGLEIDESVRAFCAENIRANGMQDRVRAYTGDLARPPAAIRGSSYAHVISNPPHLADGQGPRGSDGKARAHRENGLALPDWIGLCLRRLAPRGLFTAIYRADRLDDVLAALSGTAGDVRIAPLWPKAGRPAKRVIVQARKNAKSPATMLPGLVLHEEDGRFTEAAQAILRNGQALTL